ncbi:methyltransferase [Cupriavidus sp. CV2]|uniref:methyltransferase n=1 Tax=Cupriavidus ulmosensis TaxID=3065913 RepID=UPI00296B193F|nr:methyltransferase [Cupriavidus sp. CV2]MDW3684454.1 methyltransferase [Cupriavidus sp. CV2]
MNTLPDARDATATRRPQLLAMINANWMTQAIAVAADLWIPDLLASGPLSVDLLADGCRCHVPSIRRLLRALATLEVCSELEDGRFALGPLGELLREDAPDSLRAWALFRAKQWPAWGQLGASVRSGESYRKRTLGRDDFSYLDDDALAAALFHRAMVDLTRGVSADLMRAFAFGATERIVDVGGGHGELIATVLAAHPAMHGTLYDLAHAVAAAGSRLAEAGVADRCELACGSFFDSVPEGSDIYLLKSVLHDWDDQHSALILDNCRRAMSPQARLLVIERIAPERLSPSARDQALAAADLNMLVSLGGRERIEAEYVALLEAAGLSVARIVATAGAFSVIEAVVAD